MTQALGPPVIFLLYGIFSPGEELEPVPEPSPVWLPRAPARSRALALLQSTGAWVGCPLCAPLSPFLSQPCNRFSPLPTAGILSASAGNCVARLWWAGKDIFIGKQVPSLSAMPAGSQIQGLCLSTLLTPGYVSPGTLARNPCPSEEDDGNCPLRPARLPGCPHLGT